MHRVPGFCAVLTLLFLAACNPGPPRVPSIGEAYVGPASLNIRQDISLQSPVVATVTHGERLEILQRRRRLVRVRTPRQAEGWTDERLLLSPAEVANLRRLSEQSKSAPSQGVATTYEALNVHTAPDAHSPSFLQVKEGEKVEMIGHRVTPRQAPAPPKAVSFTQKAQNRKPTKGGKKSKEIPPPPMPSPPKLPRDWQDISKLEAALAPAAGAQQPVPTDDWSLIRNAAGETGWVLTRRLVMAIPDEVAQYAEGRRITSYLPLGETRDGAVVKKTWLWTTIESGRQPYDFDSFRVFVWSLRRHRYETGHIERNLIGFFPVLTHPVAAPRARGAKDSGSAKVPGFSIVIEKPDGLRYRRNYAFVENRVRLASEEQVAAESMPPTPEELPAPAESGRPEVAQPAGESWYGRMKRRLDTWRQGVFGR